MLVPLARESGHASYMNKSRQAGGFGAGLTSWTMAGKLNPLLNARHVPDNSNETQLTPGLCVLALVALGVASRRRQQQLAPWLWLSALSWVLAFGPLLSVNWNELPLVIGLGAPGNGFNPPWNTAALVMLNRQMVLGVPSSGTLLEMPFNWLAPHLPLLQAFRVPARLGVLVLMCCAPLAAVGLAHLLALISARRRWLQALTVASVAALMTLEYVPWPFPTSDIAVPAFYQSIARDPARYAVVDVPLATASRFMGWQTVHGKDLIVGVTARCPPQAFALAARNPLLRALSLEVFASPENPKGERPPRNFDYAPALRELQALNVRYLVVHKNRMGGERGQRMMALLRRLQLLRVFEDADTQVYRVTTR